MKKDISSFVANATGYDHELIQQILDVFLEYLLSELKTNHRVDLGHNFGSFIVREKGSSSDSGNQRVVSFKSTPTFKKFLQGSTNQSIM